MSRVSTLTSGVPTSEVARENELSGVDSSSGVPTSEVACDNELLGVDSSSADILAMFELGMMLQRF